MTHFKAFQTSNEHPRIDTHEFRDPLGLSK